MTYAPGVCIPYVPAPLDKEALDELYSGIADLIISDYRAHYSLWPQAEGHMHDCITHWLSQMEMVPKAWILMIPAPQARKDKDGQPEPLPAVSGTDACQHDFQYGKGWDYVPGACKVCVKCGMPENAA